MSTSVVKRSEGLNNRVSIIMRAYIDHMSLLIIYLFLLSNFMVFFWFYFASLYIWMHVCLLLFNFVQIPLMYFCC